MQAEAAGRGVASLRVARRDVSTGAGVAQPPRELTDDRDHLLRLGQSPGMPARAQQRSAERRQAEVGTAERIAHQKLPRAEALARSFERREQALLVAHDRGRIDFEMALHGPHRARPQQPIHGWRPERRSERPAAYEQLRMVKEVKVQDAPQRLAQLAIQVALPFEGLCSQRVSAVFRFLARSLDTNRERSAR
jgi:hypothetical protein